MSSAISALLAFVATLFRSRESLNRCAWSTWRCGISWRCINR